MTVTIQIYHQLLLINLSACSQLAKDIENEEFDLKNEENLKNILEEIPGLLISL